MQTAVVGRSGLRCRPARKCAAKASSSAVNHVCSRPSVHCHASRAAHKQLRCPTQLGAATSGKINPEARWEDQVRSGRVKNIEGREVRSLLEGGWVLLDVRPPNEVEKVALDGAVTVPLFVPDPENSIGSLLKKASAFGMGGWWLGGSHMIANTSFLAEVQGRIPRDAQVIVGCQKGLRSLAACEQLSKAGYQNLAWVNGGFDATQPGELPTVGGVDIRYAGIGGMSSILGWTEVQQNDGSGLFGGPFGIIKIAAAILVIDLLAFGVEFIMAVGKQ